MSLIIIDRLWGGFAGWGIMVKPPQLYDYIISNGGKLLHFTSDMPQPRNLHEA